MRFNLIHIWCSENTLTKNIDGIYIFFNLNTNLLLIGRFYLAIAIHNILSFLTDQKT